VSVAPLGQIRKKGKARLALSFSFVSAPIHLRGEDPVGWGTPGGHRAQEPVPEKLRTCPARAILKKGKRISKEGKSR